MIHKTNKPRGGVRTSESHPITLSWILEHRGGGRLGLCYCPGKQVRRSGIHWDRTLLTDLKRLQKVYGISTVGCLLNGAELNCFKLRNYASVVESSGLELLLFPIIEMAPPESLPLTREFVKSIVQRLEKGDHVAVHCRGGVGRAGVIAACVLLELGLARTGRRAIEQVRRLRCKQAVESYRQERFVCDFAKVIAGLNSLEGQRDSDRETAVISGRDTGEVDQGDSDQGVVATVSKLFDSNSDWIVLDESPKAI